MLSRLDESSLVVILEDLLTRRAPALEGLESHAAAIYLPTLRALHASLTEARAQRLVVDGEASARAAEARLEAARAALSTGSRLVETTLAALLAAPGLEPAVAEAAGRVRRDLLPRPLPSRGAAALARATLDVRAGLQGFTQDLARLPVLAGGTLADALRAWCTAADELDACQSLRADRKSTRRQAATGRLENRGRLVTTLLRFAQTLEDEVAGRADLPRDLADRVLARIRAANAAPSPAAANGSTSPAPRPAPARVGAGVGATPVDIAA